PTCTGSFEPQHMGAETHGFGCRASSGSARIRWRKYPSRRRAVIAAAPKSPLASAAPLRASLVVSVDNRLQLLTREGVPDTRRFVIRRSHDAKAVGRERCSRYRLAIRASSGTLPPSVASK